MRFLAVLIAFLFSLFTFHFLSLDFSSTSLTAGPRDKLFTIVYAHSQTQVIEMTSAGFVPQEASVDESSTIIFLNKDTKARWPASNIHPTHEIYPQFDPKRPIKQGESWSFNPKKVGTWKYHDHLLPHIRGTITVVAEQREGVNVSHLRGGLAWHLSFIEVIKDRLEGIISQIKNIFSRQKYLLDNASFKGSTSEDQINKLTKFANSQGAEKAWQFILNTFKGEGGSSGNIHDLAHLAGGLIFEIDGFDGIGKCSAEFAFGCFHGFLDKAFSKNLDRLLDAQNACLKLGPEGSGPVASCIHGIGHGVASFHSTDLRKSLATCRKLTFGQEFCFDGVFMEHVRSAPDSAFKKEDPLYPCNALEKQFGPTYSLTCGRNQPALLMSRFKLGFDEVIAVCSSSSSTPFKQACFESLGFALAATSDAQKIIEGCQKLRETKFVVACIKAGAGELVFQEAPGWEEKSVEVCNGTAEGRNECLAHIERLIIEYGRKKKISFPERKSDEDINLYLRKVLKVCFETAGRDGCYQEAADILYSQFGLKKSLGLLKQNENHQEVYARCHEVTHYLSRAEYERLGSIAGVYAQCDSTCHGGCYHGTLEAYLKEKDLDDVALANHFPTVCGKKEDYQKPLEFNECLHGMGHAAMFVTDMELLESLKLCDTFSEQDHKERCFTGVFMENSSSSTSFDHASIYIKADDPFYPCNSLDEKYQPLCWQYQSSYFSIISNQDWVKVANMCLQIPQRYQDRCFRTIGTNQVGFTSSLQKMKEDCDLMPTGHFRDTCVGGVVSSLSYRFVGDAKKIIEFCSLVGSDNKQTCFKQMGFGILDWNSDKNLAKESCGKIPDPQGSSWCLSVI